MTSQTTETELIRFHAQDLGKYLRIGQCEHVRGAGTITSSPLWHWSAPSTTNWTPTPANNCPTNW